MRHVIRGSLGSRELSKLTLKGSCAAIVMVWVQWDSVCGDSSSCDSEFNGVLQWEIIYGSVFPSDGG